MLPSKSCSPNENSDPSEEGDNRKSRKRIGSKGVQTPVKIEEGASSSSDNQAEYEDEAEEQEIVVRKKNRTLKTRDEFAVAGRVAKVHLQNFMCHANLEIDFDTRNCNCFYIGGPNGSGKSALFAAINIGLGGRGSDNDRGSSVKSYIKDGTTSSKVTIVLTNEGLNAHPDYGEMIVIERNIGQSSSTYTMKSLSGFGRNIKETVISRKKSDVDRIVSRFNIHLSNPAFWMSQDRSRSFLANFKAGSVYKLYQEATNLDRIRQSYARFACVLEELAVIQVTKKIELAKKGKELKRLQEVRQLHENLAIDQRDIEVFQWNLLFCSIRDMNDDLEITKNKINENERLTNDNKTRMLENRQKRMDAMRKVEECTETMEDMKMEMDEVKKELQEVKNQLYEDEQDVKQIGKEIRAKEIEMATVNSRIQSVKQEITRKMEKSGSNELKIKLEQFERKYEELKDERSRMEESGEIMALKERKDDADNGLRHWENKRYDLTREIDELSLKAVRMKEQLKRSMAVKVNKINKFGARMSEIVNEIERNKGRFEKLPKGPIGKYVSVLDTKWSYPIEECIGQMSSQFLCHSTRDADVMRQIFNSLRLHQHEKPNLIVTRYLGRKHANLMEPEKQFLTVYRMLKIGDPDIHNAIIDNSGVESILLMEHNRDAMKHMDSHHPPANASKCYTMDGSQAFVGGPNGQYRFYAGKRGMARGLFDSEDEKIDEREMKDTIAQYEKDAAALRDRELRKLEANVLNARKEQGIAASELSKFERTLAEVRSNEVRMERRVLDIQSEIENEAIQDELESLNNCVEDFMERYDKLESEVDEMKERKRAAAEKLKPSMAARDDLQKDYHVHLNDVNGLRAKLDEVRAVVSAFDKDYEKLDVVKSRFEASKQALFNEELQLKVRKEDIAKVVEQKKQSIPQPPGTGDPPDLSDFPPTDQAQKIYKEKIRRIELHKEGVDENVTMEMVQNFKDSLKMEKLMCKRIQEALECLNEVLKRRVKLYPMLKKCTEMKVRNKFKELLAIRGNFVGDLEIDNEKQTLNVRVNSCKEKDVARENTPTEPVAQPREVDEDFEEEEEESDGFIDDEDLSDQSDDDDGPRRKKTKKPKNKKKKKKDIRDLKGLSGGERSFVTAALVMSLWEVMDQPFRMMDEFDVFMDMMNRKLVMDLLVQLATDKFPHNQFIFFTPQGIKELDKVDGLQIFEMQKVREDK